MIRKQQTLTRDQWNARAKALAKAHDTVGKARYIGVTDLAGRLYKIPSTSHKGGVSYHVVTVWRHDGAHLRLHSRVLRQAVWARRRRALCAGPGAGGTGGRGSPPGGAGAVECGG